MNRTVKRGEIYYAKLNPVIGSEQDGMRPVLIVSNDIGNKAGTTVIIVPITSKSDSKSKLPTHVKVAPFYKMTKESLILAEQIRAIDKQRLGEFVGVLPNMIMEKINKALAVSIGLKVVR